MQQRIAAAMISAPASGQGKSVVTAGLARLHRNLGRRVAVFKYGPDYLDPMVLKLACGEPVYQLHPWMLGETECRQRFARACEWADLVLVEGAMGLFDGEPSSADLARLLGIPVIPVIDASAMAQTFAAVATGLAHYQPGLQVQQFIANRVAGSGHAAMLCESLPEGLSLLGGVAECAELQLPERHLGLHPAGEMEALDQRLDRIAGILADAGLDKLPATIGVAPVATSDPLPQMLSGCQIAIACDPAFAFIYPANVDLLEAMGAQVSYFSPLHDAALPDRTDAVWLPGGYPELHADELAANSRMHRSIQAHHQAGKPIFAECGGLMACVERLVDARGVAHRMMGLVPGTAVMSQRFSGLGMQSLATRFGELRGHSFHHARLEHSSAGVARTIAGRYDTPGEAVIQDRGLVASFFHAYFPSCHKAVAAVFSGQAWLAD